MDILFELLMWTVPLVGFLAAAGWLAEWIESWTTNTKN